MIAFRTQLEHADEQNKDVIKALTKLRSYIATHMNTSMGDKGVYLEHSYQRAYEAAVQAEKQAGNSSSQAYQQADTQCQSLFSKTASFPAYVQCVTDKVASLGAASDPQTSIQTPQAELYRFNFSSPLWSPDAAGLMALITFLLVTLIVLKIILVMGVYGWLRWRHRSL